MSLSIAIFPARRSALGAVPTDFFLPRSDSRFDSVGIGDRLDIEDLYKRFGPMVLRRCRWMLRDEHLAQDAMQDVFVQLLRRESMMVDYPSALLHRIATNICLNMIRDSRESSTERSEDLLHRIAAVEDHGGRIEARSMLDRIFGREKESTRTIAVLHLLDGFTLEETAQMTGMSVSGVRKRLRTLRGRIKEMGDI